MSLMLYRLAMMAYHAAIHLAAMMGKQKAKDWVQGRKNWRKTLTDWRRALPLGTRIYWFHCASLGEFEQGRPLMEALKQQQPDTRVVLTFYSPSGYALRKNYEHADFIAYLPPDSPGNARFWAHTLQPNAAIFVKYELWAFHLRALFDLGVPTYLVAASFRENHLYFKPHGRLFLRLLERFTYICTQTKEDSALLSRHGLKMHHPCGDPRVDRVLHIARQQEELPLLAAFAQGHKVLIAGSSWPPEEAQLLANPSLWQQDWKLIIAPHDVSAAHVEALCSKITLPYLRYTHLSSAKDPALKTARVLVLDTIGLLSRAYRYGTLAYVGGAFGAGLHNTLEPAAFGLPLLFGPKHQQFPEAVAFAASGGARVIQKPEDFPEQLAYLQNEQHAISANAHLRQYMNGSSGATARVMAVIA